MIAVPAIRIVANRRFDPTLARVISICLILSLPNFLFVGLTLDWHGNSVNPFSDLRTR